MVLTHLGVHGIVVATRPWDLATAWILVVTIVSDGPVVTVE